MSEPEAGPAPRPGEARPRGDELELEVRYRALPQALPPRRIKLAVPGWAGESSAHGEGSPAQPWHCQPFVDGSTCGLELLYPFRTECRVTRDGDGLRFEGDFGDELSSLQPGTAPGASPFAAFAAHHYGLSSLLDVVPPPGYALRLEPHPRFFTDTTGEVPIAVPGHLQRFWPRKFFVVFKAPPPGAVHVFRQGEPYAQLLLVPTQLSYRLQPMEPEQAEERDRQERQIGTLGWLLSKHIWRSSAGLWFDDKYKQLLRVFRASGLAGVRDLLDRTEQRARLQQPAAPPGDDNA